MTICMKSFRHRLLRCSVREARSYTRLSALQRAETSVTCHEIHHQPAHLPRSRIARCESAQRGERRSDFAPERVSFPIMATRDFFLVLLFPFFVSVFQSILCVCFIFLLNRLSFSKHFILVPCQARARRWYHLQLPIIITSLFTLNTENCVVSKFLRHYASISRIHDIILY